MSGPIYSYQNYKPIRTAIDENTEEKNNNIIGLERTSRFGKISIAWPQERCVDAGNVRTRLNV